MSNGFKRVGYLSLAGSALALAAGGMAGALARRAAAHGRKVFGAENIRRAIQTYGGTSKHRRGNSIAQGNRHGGAHLHVRERARRLYRPGDERRAFIAAHGGR